MPLFEGTRFASHEILSALALSADGTRLGSVTLHSELKISGIGVFP